MASRLSRFVKSKVQGVILELTAERAKMNNRDVSETELNDMVEEALQWAREARALERRLK